MIDISRLDADARKVAEASSRYLRCPMKWSPWPGTRRAIPADLQGDVCRHLDATEASTTTPVYDMRHPALAKIQSFRREATAWWKGQTMPWPEEDGCRLLPKTALDAFEAGMTDRALTLRSFALDVQAARQEILERARPRRGRAFSEADYPADLSELFGITWGPYGSLKVSKEIADLSSGAFAAEQSRQMARVLGAVRIGEEMQVRELHSLVSSLFARLSAVDEPREPGAAKPKLFVGALEAITEFASRFSHVVVWGTEEIEEVVREAGTVATVDVDDLRRSREMREETAENLQQVRRKLEAIMPQLVETERLEALRAPAVIRVNEELEAALLARGAVQVEETRETSYSVAEEA